MNYKQIKQDCPKAWAKWIEWDFIRWGKSAFGIINDIEQFEKVVHGNKTNVNRYLYDFFDGNGLFVLINPDWGKEYIRLSWAIGHWKEINGKQFMYTENQEGGYDTRTEAEEAAFTKAFEILEQQLNK